MAYRARVRGSVSGWECARLTLLSNAYEGALRLNLKPSGEARGPVRQDREFAPLKQMTPAMQWLSASIFLVPCLAFIIIMEVGSLSYDGYLPFMKEADSLAKYRKENPTVLTRKGPAPGAFDAKVPSGFSAVQYQSGDRKLLAWLSVPKAAGKHRAVFKQVTISQISNADSKAAIERAILRIVDFFK